MNTQPHPPSLPAGHASSVGVASRDRPATATVPRLRRAPRHPPIRALAAGAVLALILAACGAAPASTNGVATLQSPGGTATPASSRAPSGSQDPYQAMLAYAQCMRSHGVTTFPDPVSNGSGGGGFEIRGGPGTGLDPNSATFQAAQQACQSLMPGDQTAGSGPADPQLQAQALRFSACMRSHGVPDFPDPEVSGNSVRIAIKAGTGIDPNSATFQAARQACQSLMPGRVGSGGPVASGNPGAGSSPTTSGSQP